MGRYSAQTLLTQNYSFMQDYLSNCIMVPELLLAEYQQLGLSDSQFVMLLRLINLHNKQGSFTAEEMAEEFSIQHTEAQHILRAFADKSLITLKDEGGEGGRYNLDGLFGELFESWYYTKNCSRPRKRSRIVKSQKGENNAKSKSQIYQDQLGGLYQAFEKEMGRGLSPVEGEKLIHWLVQDIIAPEMIMEALRRAVMQGKVSFSYIDRILFNWKKQNLRSLAEVKAKDRHPLARDKGRGKNPIQSEYNSVYDRIIKS